MPQLPLVYPPAEILRNVTDRDLTDSLVNMAKEPFDQGAHANLFLAELGGVQVCAKVLRLVGASSDECAKERLNQSALRELAIWINLCHKNILSCYGYSTSPGPSLTFVCPYVPAGNARSYMLSNPSVDRLAFVAELGEGLAYLHSHNIVHGDLKGVNVLVGDAPTSPTPLLCDFGSAEVSDTAGSISNPGGTTNWMAKELLGDSDDSRLTAGSDIWAWGMTVYELATDTIPYSDLQLKPFVLVRQISAGRLPSPPGPLAVSRGLGCEMWALLQSCWVPDIPSRPSSASVVTKTWKIHAQWLKEKNDTLGHLSLWSRRLRSILFRP